MYFCKYEELMKMNISFIFVPTVFRLTVEQEHSSIK